MRCLCCGKPLSEDELETGWHKKCIKRFFGTDKLPIIDIDSAFLEALAIESVNKGLTVPGVQKKLSLHLFSHGKEKRLTFVNYPSRFILKPQVSDFKALPESEQLVMSMAETVGISAVPHALIKSGDEYAYITRRVDRFFKRGKVHMLAMEDFCQLDLRSTQDKYKGSYERCAKIIERFSCRKALDKTELFLRLIFCFVVGNSDMHLKNFSLIETNEASGLYSLAPAYDLLPVNVIMPEDIEQFALTLNGKKRNLRKSDFLQYAQGSGISKKAAENMIGLILSKKQLFLEMIDDSLLPGHLKLRMKDLVLERMQVLG